MKKVLLSAAVAAILPTAVMANPINVETGTFGGGVEGNLEFNSCTDPRPAAINDGVVGCVNSGPTNYVYVYGDEAIQYDGGGQALIDKLKAAETFNQGFETVEYLGSAIVDMKIHMDPSGEIDPAAAEKTILGEIGMPREIVMRHRLPQFGHLFSSDAYSAGYYSYLWSDVMAADAWAAFEEAGDPWDAATAKKFKDIILATGDAIDRAEAYRMFRGRDPQVEALLKNRGFPTD